MLVNILVHGVRVVNWFNPLVWLLTAGVLNLKVTDPADADLHVPVRARHVGGAYPDGIAPCPHADQKFAVVPGRLPAAVLQHPLVAQGLTVVQHPSAGAPRPMSAGWCTRFW